MVSRALRLMNLGYGKDGDAALYFRNPIQSSTFQHKKCVPGVPVFNIKNLLNEGWQLKDNELKSC